MPQNIKKNESSAFLSSRAKTWGRYGAFFGLGVGPMIGVMANLYGGTDIARDAVKSTAVTTPGLFAVGMFAGGVVEAAQRRKVGSTVMSWIRPNKK